MTGISSPYEPPAQPDLVINSTIVSTEDAVAQISIYLAGGHT